jgi:hypothetical protein
MGSKGEEFPWHPFTMEGHMVITKHFFKPLKKYLAIFIHLFHCANMTIPLKNNTSREVTNNYTLHHDEYQKILFLQFLHNAKSNWYYQT